jgi:LysR family nitrogen assimilation transcriptional regulator
MSVDFTKLKSFVKIVDVGSMSRASDILRTAQPALSQQISSLEAHFKQKLLIRSTHGVSPTKAGSALYRHAQLILRQLELAQADVSQAATSLSGRVSIGLATYSATSTLSIPFLKRMSDLYPDVIVYINDNFGHVLSELIMTGRMDMAVIYRSDPIKGVQLRPLFREELFLVTPPGEPYPDLAGTTLPISALVDVKLLLPSRIHFLRHLIDESFSRARTVPHVAAEIESVATLGAALQEGLGATILPWSIASAIVGSDLSRVRRLTRPKIEATVSLCVSDHLPLSEPASAALAVLLQVVGDFIKSGQSGIEEVPTGRDRDESAKLTSPAAS